MRILIADTLSEAAQAALEAGGHQVTVRAGVKDEALVEALRDVSPQVLIVRSTKVKGAALDASANLELIVRAGAGVDTIDVEGASARGIFVANCPGKNADAVAELTMGLLLALDRQIPANVADARGGQWRKGHYSKAAGLKGRTLGVVGVGSIGEGVIKRAKAFGMRVVAWSRSLTPEKAQALGAEHRDSPLEVAREADIVTLHVASTPATRQMADRAFFEAMKDGAFFVNTTRADVVDEDALAWAVEHKHVRAALDVFSGEPSGKEGTFEHPLARHEGVYVTHHVGASTEQAQEAIADEAARIVNTYAATGRVPNCVNLAERSPATHLLTVRHHDRVGVLASVLNEVRAANWNVQEMENLIFEGAQAACARIRFTGEPDDATRERIRALDHVLDASIIEL